MHEESNPSLLFFLTPPMLSTVPVSWWRGARPEGRGEIKLQNLEEARSHVCGYAGEEVCLGAYIIALTKYTD